MAQVTVEIDTKQLKGFLKGLEDASGQIVRITAGVMGKGMALAERYAKENLTRKILFPRTGKLRASVKGEVEIGSESSDGGGAITGRLGILKPANAKVPLYGGAQEFGAEAKPVKAKVMTIPLRAALTPAGVPRFTALQAKHNKTLFDRTFWYNDILYGVKVGAGRGKRKRTLKDTNKFIRLNRDAGVRRDKLIPLFYAATHVKIGGGPGAGRKYLHEARDRVLPDIQAAIGVKVADLLHLRRQHGN